jgi:hypothetical protein
MRRAIKEQVLSQQEAEAWHEVVLSAQGEFTPLPPQLHDAAERVYLWENPPENVLPV